LSDEWKKKKYIEMFGSFTEPFNCLQYCFCIMLPLCPYKYLHSTLVSYVQYSVYNENVSQVA